MSRCTHSDCFTCPYPDCISDCGPKVARSKRKKLSPSEAKIRRAESNKKYYQKNKAMYSQLHKENYEKRKERKNGIH